MKLNFVIVRDADADTVVQTLVKNHYRVMREAGRGGFLRHGNVTLMTSIEENHVQAVIDLFYQACCPPEDSKHRATIFVVDMAYFEQI